MKKSEVLAKYREGIAATMLNCYRSVLNSDGRIQYKIFIWDDGIIETLEGVQGDNSWLQPREYEFRSLYYVCTVDSPCFDPWDYADHSAPEDETARETEETEIIDWLIDDYKSSIPDLLDTIIEEDD